MKIQYQTHLSTNQSKYSNCKQPEKKKPLTLIVKDGHLGVTQEIQPSKNKELKPWRTPDGSLKTDDEISKLGQEWSSNTWNEYLETVIGDVENSNKDQICIASMDSLFVAEGFELLEFLRSIEEYEYLHVYLDFAIKKLPKRTRQVIRELYFEKVLHKDLAKKMNISIETVRSLRKKGIKKLKNLLTSSQFREETKHLISLKNSFKSNP